MTAIALLPVLGSAAGAVYLYSSSWSRVGPGALIAMAALVCGGLFGIPRGGAQGAEPGGHTILEQISDWLTKILDARVGSATVILDAVDLGQALLANQPWRRVSRCRHRRCGLQHRVGYVGTVSDQLGHRGRLSDAHVTDSKSVEPLATGLLTGSLDGWSTLAAAHMRGDEPTCPSPSPAASQPIT